MRLGTEEVYDELISPLVVKILALCRSVNPSIPIVSCSSCLSGGEKEISCSSSIGKGGATRRMLYIAKIAANYGRTSLGFFNTLIWVGDVNLDEDWYKATPQHHKVMKEISPILNKIEELVNDDYCFPAAIIIQTPTPLKYKKKSENETP